MKIKNKKGMLKPIVRALLWIVLFAILSLAVYILVKTFTTI